MMPYGAGFPQCGVCHKPVPRCTCGSTPAGNADTDRLLIVRLAQLLDTTPAEARDWLIYRASAFRGMTERDFAALLEDTG